MAFVEQTGKRSWRVRYWRDDGTHGTISGFPTKTAAEDKVREIDADRHRGQFIDPHGGTTPLSEWADSWFDALDVAPATIYQYRSLSRCHILPRWGSSALGEIKNLQVKAWVNKLRADGYARSTVATIVKVLTMMLDDAVDDGLIAANPIRANRRGRRQHEPVSEITWGTPEQIVKVALNAARLQGPMAGVLLVTAGWTGGRWGELAGLHRDNLHLGDDGAGRIVIDPQVGALHEVGRDLYLGPPKTAESARPITLPPFLVELLRFYLSTHRHGQVFTAADGSFLRRSNFGRRALRPAADGTIHLPRPKIAVQPVIPTLTFHGLRHSHNTWLIADDIPRVARARRLGHKLKDKIENTYSHVAPEVEARLLSALQTRWINAIAAVSAPTPQWMPTGDPALHTTKVLPAQCAS